MQNITVTSASHPQHKDITLLSVKGFIDTTTAPEFEKAFQRVLSENKFNLIVDLKETNYISSVGWGIFIGELKRIRGQKGNLYLVSLGPEVTDAFELLEFDTILKTFSSVEDAVQNGFGRGRGAKGAKKPQTERFPENPPMETTLGKAKIEMSYAEPRADKTLNRPHWLVRLLIPWKWF